MDSTSSSLPAPAFFRRWIRSNDVSDAKDKQQALLATAAGDGTTKKPPPPFGSDDDDDNRWKAYFGPNSSAMAWMWGAGGRVFLKTVLGATVALYLLNQGRLLPQPLSAVVSRVLFWPTLPITVGRRLGRWTTVIDETVIMGGAPFGFAGYPKKLYEQFHVRTDVSYYLRCCEFLCVALNQLTLSAIIAATCFPTYLRTHVCI